MNVETVAVAPATSVSVRPVEVTNAIKLVALNFVVGWIAMVVSWDYFSALYPSSTKLVVNQVFCTAVWVWILYKIYHGRNWARILLVVFTVLGFAMTWSGVFAGIIASAPIVAKLSTAFAVVVNLTVLWLLFVSKGRLWFRKRPKPSPSPDPNGSS